MRIEVTERTGEVVLTLVGRLEVRTAPRIATALGKHLAGTVPVLVDLSRLVLLHPASVAVFPAARRAAGPAPAPLVVFAARPDMAAALRSSRVSLSVVVASDLFAARAAVRADQPTVSATYCLPDPRRIADVVRSACNRWRLPPLHREMVVAAAEEVVGPCGEQGCDVRLEYGERHVSVHVREHGPFGGTAAEEREVRVSLIDTSH